MLLRETEVKTELFRGLCLGVLHTELSLHPGVMHWSTPTALGGAGSLLRPTGFITAQEICELLLKHPITVADAAC